MMEVTSNGEILMDEGQRRRLIELIKRVQGDRSQRKFARDIGINPATLSNWLDGRIPQSENLEKLAAAAGMSFEELMSQIRGEEPEFAPKVAEDVLQVALRLDPEQRRRLIKLLVDTI